MKRFLQFYILSLPLAINAQIPVYPVTEMHNVIDTFYNIPVYDEYRWLEDIKSGKTMDWVSQQNALTEKILRKASLKSGSYNAIDKYSYVRYKNPIKQRDYYFTYAYYNDVGAPALFYQRSMREDPTILVDPNFISPKDNISIKRYSVSKDSKLLAYQFSRNGSDWCEMNVINLNTAIHQKDHLKNVKFSNIAWKEDGFYYSRFPQQNLAPTSGQEICYHKLGSEQDQDNVIFKRENNPLAFFSVMTTSDERYMVLKEEDEKKGHSNLFYIDFSDSIPAIKPLLTRLTKDDNLEIVDNKEKEFIAISFKGNNNGMVVKINPSNPRQWKTIIPEFKSALLLEVKLLEDKIIGIYQINRKQQIIFFDYEGKVLHAIQLPFGFSANGFNGEKTDKKILFSYSGYIQPKVVYILDTETFEMVPLNVTTVNFDCTQFETKELEYTSFDGTIIPLFMIYLKGLNLTNNNPTLLNAYGGFGIIESPSFDPGIVHFLKEGGIFVFANIRGGGDNGKEWAMQGRGVHKQNSFNDFIAAAEFLIKNNYSSPAKLAITGSSNGGLVVAVAMTQRPELFKVVVPVVAPMDMIRFENFTIGHEHADEYGSVADSAGFKSLLSYSPLQNIKDNLDYPATLIMTSDNDDRVPPLHSYKFAAKLQSRKAQKNPVLLRVEKKAGHNGASGSFQEQLREEGDMYDFILSNLVKD